MSTPSPDLPEVARPSFDEVYRAELSHVLWLVRRLGVPERLAEDAAQEVFVVVHQRLPEYAPQDRLRGWLGAIARNVAARLRTRKSFAMEVPHAAPVVADEGLDALDVLEEIASAEEVALVLDEVEPDLRWLFI